jgi:hypothetical protein
VQEPPPKWDGHAAERIVEVLERFSAARTGRKPEALPRRPGERAHVEDVPFASSSNVPCASTGRPIQVRRLSVSEASRTRR